MTESVVTLNDVASPLKLYELSNYRNAERNEIPAFKVGGTWRFRRGDPDSWIVAQVAVRKPRKAAQ